MAGFIIYQLTRGDEGPAIHVAEVTGWSDAAIVEVAQTLVRYELAKEWLAPEAEVALYAFIKHDTRSTRNIELQLGDEREPLETGAANALVKAAVAGKPKVGFMIKPNRSISPMVLIGPPQDLSGLAKYYAS